MMRLLKSYLPQEEELLEEDPVDGATAPRGKNCSTRAFIAKTAAALDELLDDGFTGRTA